MRHCRTNSLWRIKFVWWIGVILPGLLAFGVFRADAQSFRDDFTAPALDPAWQVVQYTGLRVYGYTSPANHFSLTENPGQLRYLLDEMTHWDGYVNDYQPSYGQHSCCNHDFGLELHRPLTGDNWTLETKASYNLPYTNGRYLGLRVYFGDGGANTFYVAVYQGRDLTPPFLGADLAHKTGPNWPADVTLLDHVSTEGTPWEPPPTVFYRIERSGGVLTARYSVDETSWTLFFARDLGTQLDGLAQRVVLIGMSWFSTGGSYADWDYVVFYDSFAAGAVSGLRWTAASRTSLEWDPAPYATFYNLYRGIPSDLGDLLDGDPDSCRRATTASLTTGTTLTELPDAGSFYWYLVRAVNAGGEGLAGLASAGPRIQSSSGTCP